MLTHAHSCTCTHAGTRKRPPPSTQDCAHYPASVSATQPAHQRSPGLQALMHSVGDRRQQCCNSAASVSATQPAHQRSPGLQALTHGAGDRRQQCCNSAASVCATQPAHQRSPGLQALTHSVGDRRQQCCNSAASVSATQPAHQRSPGLQALTHGAGDRRHVVAGKHRDGHAALCQGVARAALPSLQHCSAVVGWWQGLRPLAAQGAQQQALGNGSRGPRRTQERGQVEPGPTPERASSHNRRMLGGEWN